MTRAAGLILLCAAALAACGQRARTPESSRDIVFTAGNPQRSTDPRRPSDDLARAAIEVALANRLSNETASGMTEPCGGLFALRKVTVISGSGDGTRAEVAYDARVRAQGEFFGASDRYNRCYEPPGRARHWRQGQEAEVRQIAEFERVGGTWRVIRIRAA